jgi:hypothetical protein
VLLGSAAGALTGVGAVSLSGGDPFPPVVAYLIIAFGLGAVATLLGIWLRDHRAKRSDTT